MMQLPRLDLANYQYPLPEDRIARYPLDKRDESKLLVWKRGEIVHTSFMKIADFLPVNSSLFFNNTKVIPARILFEKPTGGTIEVFLLRPSGQVGMVEGLRAKSPTIWACTVGNAKRWPTTSKLSRPLGQYTLMAEWCDRSEGLVKFSWSPADIPMAKVVDMAGAIPLPPYLKRAAEPLDRERYQTTYSKFEGAVAAPTAGLHFTPDVIASLEKSGRVCDYLTLHISAGTFFPIKSDNAAEHRMHEEEIVIRKSTIVKLLEPNRTVIAVGTTAMRTLESVFWFGVKLCETAETDFVISQDYPHENQGTRVTRTDALQQVLKRMEELGVEELAGHTSIYVMPGYRFRVTDGLLTNFHQPGSSLLVLVSAFVGPAWKEIYQHALEHGYRFLSYGDSSLLLP